MIFIVVTLVVVFVWSCDLKTRLQQSEQLKNEQVLCSAERLELVGLIGQDVVVERENNYYLGQLTSIEGNSIVITRPDAKSMTVPIDSNAEVTPINYQSPEITIRMPDFNPKVGTPKP